LIQKRDPKLERFTDIVGAKLGNILQKPEFEMQMMLRRTCFMNKKRDKKTEIDKAQQMIKQVMEKSLMETNNSKNLNELPQNFTLNFSSHIDLLLNFIRDVNEYVTIGNDYLKCKTSEEQAKVSSPSGK